MSSALFRVIVFVVSWLLAAPVVAQATDDELARSHFQLGTAQLDRGDYEGAVRSFDEAYRLSGRAGLLFNLYVANERLGRLEVAIGHLDRYLASGEPVENRAALETRLASLRRRLEAQRAGVAVVETVAAEPVATVPAETTPAAASTREPSRDSGGERGGPSLAPLLLWSSAGAMAVSFTTAAFLARAEDRRLDDRCDPLASPCSDADVSALRRRNLTADISLGLTVGLAAAALVVQLVADDEAAPALAVVPFASTTAAGLAVGGRF